ncbi:MAG: CocE/NonD family hydrolase [Candidatus Glassbacteria bacterium]
MKTTILSFLAVLYLASPGDLALAQNQQFQALHSHFERVVRLRFDSLFTGIENVRDWEKKRADTRKALIRMLWGGRSRSAGPPVVRITHRVDRPGYTLECLVFENAPSTFATANLYLPRKAKAPYPVILYQCGHAPNGPYGSKNVYKHHGAWFASQGIAVLVLDNIEMGETQSTHHGVFPPGWFDWYSRGYSPLGVELFNACRALDYLVTRPEIDSSRIGATGISGGGMTSFFLPAVDDRVKAAAPVSGALSTPGWIEGRLSSAHCDCQWPVNSHGLLYSEIGALAAPRPFLFCNADSDPGFPMPAFNEMIDKIRKVYSLYGAGNNLRTAVVPGGHADTEAIRLPVYSFFLREFLGIDTTFDREGAIDTLPREDLLCFRDGYPLDERNSTIWEHFIPLASFDPKPLPEAERQNRLNEIIPRLGGEVFRYFPASPAPLEPAWGEQTTMWKRSVRKVSFNSFPDLRVSGVYSVPAGAGEGPVLPAVLVVDDRRGIRAWGNDFRPEGYQWGNRAVLIAETLDQGSRAIDEDLRNLRNDDPIHHLKREAMVTGTTFDGMRVYEILRSLELIRSQTGGAKSGIIVYGRGAMGINGLYAALLDGNVERVLLESPTSSHRNGPYYLDVLRYTDIPEIICLLSDKVRLLGEVPPEIREAVGKTTGDRMTVYGSLAECLK